MFSYIKEKDSSMFPLIFVSSSFELKIKNEMLSHENTIAPTCALVLFKVHICLRFRYWVYQVVL
jgi:hypothetical protein